MILHCTCVSSKIININWIIYFSILCGTQHKLFLPFRYCPEHYFIALIDVLQIYLIQTHSYSCTSFLSTHVNKLFKISSFLDLFYVEKNEIIAIFEWEKNYWKYLNGIHELFFKLWRCLAPFYQHLIFPCMNHKKWAPMITLNHMAFNFQSNWNFFQTKSHEVVDNMQS